MSESRPARQSTWSGRAILPDYSRADRIADYMSRIQKPPTSWRGDVMRRIAAIHVEIHGLDRAEMSAEKFDTRIKELRKQLAALQAEMLT